MSLLNLSNIQNMLSNLVLDSFTGAGPATRQNRKDISLVDDGTFAAGRFVKHWLGQLITVKTAVDVACGEMLPCIVNESSIAWVRLGDDNLLTVDASYFTLTDDEVPNYDVLARVELLVSTTMRLRSRLFEAQTIVDSIDIRVLKADVDAVLAHLLTKDLAGRSLTPIQVSILRSWASAMCTWTATLQRECRALRDALTAAEFALSCLPEIEPWTSSSPSPFTKAFFEKVVGVWNVMISQSQLALQGLRDLAKELSSARYSLEGLGSTDTARLANRLWVNARRLITAE